MPGFIDRPISIDAVTGEALPTGLAWGSPGHLLFFCLPVLALAPFPDDPVGIRSEWSQWALCLGPLGLNGDTRAVQWIIVLREKPPKKATGTQETQRGSGASLAVSTLNVGF